MPEFTPEGVNHTACVEAVESLRQVGVYGCVPVVAANLIEQRKYEDALTYLLGAYDVLASCGHHKGADRLGMCRMQLKAAIPARR